MRRAGQVPAHGARVPHLDRGDPAADDPLGQALPDRLHLGQLRHGSCPAARPPSRSRRPRTAVGHAGAIDIGRVGVVGSAGAVVGRLGHARCSVRQAASAARCSASFLLRPSAPPYRSPATTTQAVKVFAWSGPGLVDPVLRHAEPQRRGQLLQAGLPVQRRRPGRPTRPSAGRRAGGSPPRRCPGRTAGRSRRAAPPGCRRGCSPCPGRRCVSSPLPSSRYGAEPVRPEPAGHVGQRPHVDHAGPQLGQLPLGQVRVVVEERGGDHHAEHRVAEELQPLVGRQAAVLVRVRAVGQRPLAAAPGRAPPRTPPPGGRSGAAAACRWSCASPRCRCAIGAASPSGTAGEQRRRRRGRTAPPVQVGGEGDAGGDVVGAAAAPWQTTTVPATPSRAAARGAPPPAGGPPAIAYAPSMPLSSTLPVKPSVTTTSARAADGDVVPLDQADVAAAAGQRRARRAAASAARRSRSPLPGLGADREQPDPRRGDAVRDGGVGRTEHGVPDQGRPGGRSSEPPDVEQHHRAGDARAGWRPAPGDGRPDQRPEAERRRR